MTPIPEIAIPAPTRSPRGADHRPDDATDRTFRDVLERAVEPSTPKCEREPDRPPPRTTTATPSRVEPSDRSGPSEPAVQPGPSEPAERLVPTEQLEPTTRPTPPAAPEQTVATDEVTPAAAEVGVVPVPRVDGAERPTAAPATEPPDASDVRPPSTTPRATGETAGERSASVHPSPETAVGSAAPVRAVLAAGRAVDGTQPAPPSTTGSSVPSSTPSSTQSAADRPSTATDGAGPTQSGQPAAAHRPAPDARPNVVTNPGPATAPEPDQPPVASIRTTGVTDDGTVPTVRGPIGSNASTGRTAAEAVGVTRQSAATQAMATPATTAEPVPTPDVSNAPRQAADGPIAAPPASPVPTPAPMAGEPAAATPTPAANTEASVNAALDQLKQAELHRIAGQTRLGVDIATDELGHVRIEAAGGRNDLQMNLSADDANARAALQERLPELRDQLRNAGFDSPSLDVGTRDARRNEADSAPDRGEPAEDLDSAASDVAASAVDDGRSDPTEPRLDADGVDLRL